ncbi:hypothetical protein HMN09_00979100 [Mycena chlorophos]|uniref:Uncharacterized protein n=1 Tax=Mycena chlorophos TaxID=658473 RepID=A0A8H6W2X2_MYCCL|nr:hypothetical protein HMN09_00979100 [Mycena chlorophos]
MSRHPNHPEYADPVVREASPMSSVGSVHGPDQTNSSDAEDQLDQWAFERKWADRLELRRATREEEQADIDPLFPRPSTAVEEKILHERILRNLRAKIAELEDDELFEKAILRGSQVGMEDYAVPSDIDNLMRDMMLTGAAAAPNSSTAPGPWNHGPMRFDTSFLDQDSEAPEEPQRAPPPLRRTTRAKGKSRK